MLLVSRLMFYLQKERSNAGTWNEEDAILAANLAFIVFVDRFSIDPSKWPNSIAPLLTDAWDRAFAKSHWANIAATEAAHQKDTSMDVVEEDAPDDLDNVVGLSPETRLRIRAARIERKPLADTIQILNRGIQELGRMRRRILRDFRHAERRPPQNRESAIAAVDARWGEDSESS